MLRKLIFLTCFFIMVIEPSVVFGDTLSSNSYEKVVSEVKSGHTDVDFKALRIAYTRTPQYNPYAKDENIPLMFDSLQAKEFSKAVQYAQSVLEKNYVDIDAHYVLYLAYGELGDTKRSEFHQTVAMSLIDSIAQHNGSSPESALEVINVREEYVMLSVAGLEMQKQSLQQINNKNYDVIEAINRETGQTFTLYFDITVPYEWLNKSLTTKQ